MIGSMGITFFRHPFPEERAGGTFPVRFLGSSSMNSMAFGAL